MTSLTKTTPIWPGLDMSRKIKDMARTSKQGANKMATVKAARIVEERYKTGERDRGDE